MSCLRLRGLGAPDEDEGGMPPHCEFVRGLPSDDLFWGREQCAGYDPRPPWDFAIAGSSAKSAAGAKIVAPGAGRRRRRPEEEDAIIIDPKEVDAVIIAPERRPKPPVAHCGGTPCLDPGTVVPGPPADRPAVAPGGLT